MQDMTSEERFAVIVGRINRYLVVMGVFYLVYFLLKTKVDTFLFLLALMHVAFSLLSHKHLIITNRLAAELRRAKLTLEDVAKETRDIHPDLNA